MRRRCWAHAAWIGVLSAACGAPSGVASAVTGSAGNGNVGGIANAGSANAGGARTSTPTAGAGGLAQPGNAAGASTSDVGGGASGGGVAVGGAGGSAVSGAGGASGSTEAGGATSGGNAATAGAGSGGDATDVTVHLDRSEQTMTGFGVSNTFAPAMTDMTADQLFDTTTGIGLSILRVAMSSNGEPFNRSLWDDVILAKERGVTTFVANAWTAPASCKTNASENDGGHLLPECYESWSDTLAVFPVKFAENTGVELYGMAPQQMPDFASCGREQPCNGNFPSMLYTAEEMVDMINVLGPKLRGLDPPVRVMGPDTSEWIHLWSNESAPGSSDPLSGEGYDYGHALFADATAWGLVDILATQQYDTQVAEPWPSDVPQTKPIWMTEMSGITWWPEEGPSDDIDNGLAVAGWIHDAIANGSASAWLYFWRQSINIDNNEGLILKDGRITKRFHVLGNFSRYIRPGAVRVSITGNVPANVWLTAYQGPAGNLVVVAINRSDANVSVPIFVAGGPVPASVTPIVTSASDSLAEKLAVTPSDGSFTATLDAKSITTFVGAAP